MADAPHERTKRLGHRADAPVPISTYRVQLTPDFTFDDAAAQLDYFAALGVSHLYLSPILTAAPGSTHFYDVVDHSRVADVLGGEDGLRRLAWEAGERGIGLIADVVPNHMSVPTPVYHNRALWSVLAEGEASPYAHWFDVDWSSNDGVLMPILGDRIGSILSRDELTLDTMVVPGFEDAGEVPVLRYYDHVFPVREGTENLPMDTLVVEQHYRLAYWRVANEEFNYRRFFDVGSLVAVRVEDPDVFEATHRRIIDLVKDGTLEGLRIDHPDGLADPAGYIAQLSDATDGAWIVVEKILEDEERLPTSWKTAGTTGYDASWRVGALLRDPAGAAPLAGTLFQLDGRCDGFTARNHRRGEAGDRARIRCPRKRVGWRRSRTRCASQTCACATTRGPRSTTAFARCSSRSAGIARTSFRASRPSRLRSKPSTRRRLARVHNSTLSGTRLLTWSIDLLKGSEVGSAGKTFDTARLQLVTRFQQACGAVMAKGVEDTAYYRWTHLLPLCEVGSPAGRFAVPPAAFHAWAADQQFTYPHAMTTLTTHDTKRSEDVRARLGVLSEVSEAWDEWLGRAREATAELRPAELDGRTENLWWQTLVGTVDMDGSLMAWDRLEGYLTKAMREAKTHTTWTGINESYESAVLWFAQATHADPSVHELVAEWTAATEHGVRAAVLSQKLIQLTIPGIPDVYQGTEEFRPMLVDPDNRRPVDFVHLASQLGRVTGRSKTRNVSEEKHRVTARALHSRATHSEAFVGEGAGLRAAALIVRPRCRLCPNGTRGPSASSR